MMVFPDELRYFFQGRQPVVFFENIIRPAVGGDPDLLGKYIAVDCQQGLGIRCTNTNVAVGQDGHRFRISGFEDQALVICRADEMITRGGAGVAGQ